MATFWFWGCTQPTSDSAEVVWTHPPPGFSWSDEICCPTPVEGFDRLREEGQTRGLDIEIEGITQQSAGNVNGGLSTGDLDLDGDLDLVFGSLDNRPRILINDGKGSFTESAQPNLSLQAEFGTLASQHGVIDVNGDGWIDLVQIGMGAAWVYWNEGELEFSPPEPIYVEQQWPMVQLGSMAWGDMDGDGDLDVLLTGLEVRGKEPSEDGLPLGHPEILLRNDEGQFESIAELSPNGTSGVNITATFTDRDGDGDQDLLVPADLGQIMADLPPSAFYRNDGLDNDGLPIWFNDAPEIGADVHMSSMGLVTGDWNDDLQFDYCISDIGPVLCLMSQSDGNYYEGGVALGLQASSTDDPDGWSGWGIEVGDFDNDGLEDAVAAGGQPIGGFSTGQTYPDIIWQGIDGAQARFKDVTNSVAFGSDQDHYGLVTADFDGDGWLEIVTSGVPGPPLYWQNQCGSNAWTSIELRGPLPNWQAFGARVELTVGDRTWVREVQNMHSMSQHSPILHFGLGEATQIDRLFIRWPNGSITEEENLPVRRMMQVFHPELAE